MGRHRDSGYEWWICRVKRVLQLCDLLRIDHFRGFEAYWAIPAHLPDARIGEWRPGPGADFFNNAIGRSLHSHGNHSELPVIAEDLGFITPEVHKLRDQFHFLV